MQKCSIDEHVSGEEQLNTEQISRTIHAGGPGPPFNRAFFFGDYTCLANISSSAQRPFETTKMASSDCSEPDIEEMIM